MRILLAIAGLLTGLVLWTAPSFAHGSHSAAVDKPAITAEKDVPTGPRICLFSQNGKRAGPAPGDGGEQVEPPRDKAAQPVSDNARREAAAPAKRDVAQSQPESDAQVEASQRPSASRAADRVCDTDVAAPVPHG